ncbi:MAG: endonuclease/exonuclease/phosphatase family protein [Deltaproteobacteria bacterium]|jgi:endonuclease/exonuclease/phosphatase family metal-dependent hydrolase|nr:endonuclease/exonuclease/phosphatase family protein [Deltaproteobacteria bacterium]
MNKWIPIFMLALLLGCGNVHNIRTIDAAAGTVANGELKIMTFNIRAAGGMQNPLQGAGGKSGGGLPPITNPGIVEETRASLTRIATAIKSIDPDMIGLQEVRGIHQAKFIAQTLNLNYVYAVHPREHWWGLAVLSKFKIAGARTKIVNLGGRHGDRIALICSMEVNGRNLMVVNVAFVPENFKEQVSETLSLVNPLEGPTVLLGDFSRPPEYAQMKPIRETLMAACEAVPDYEGPCIDPVHGKVDYIFVDPKRSTVLAAASVSMPPQDSQAPTGAWALMKLID